MKVIEWRGKPKCPECGSLNVHKDGLACYCGVPKQRYQCGNCDKRFRPSLRFECIVVEREKVPRVCDYIQELEKAINSKKSNNKKFIISKKLLRK